MGNCLITKLKGVVDNDNLMKYGHLRIKAATDGEGALIIRPKYGESFVMKTVGITPEVSLTVEYDTPMETLRKAFASLPKDTVIDVSNKYVIRQVFTEAGGKWNIILDDYEYSPVDYVACYANPNLRGDIAKITKTATKISYFNVRNSGVYGDIACFAGKLDSYIANEEINFSYCAGIYGDLANLIGFSGSAINISATGITTAQATLDTLVNAGIRVSYDPSQVID